MQEFVYGTKFNVPDYMIENGRDYRIISNQVGTPEMVVDASTGRIVQRLSFDEFGIPQATDDGFMHDRDDHNMIPFGFAGGLYDAQTGLVHFGAREYGNTWTWGFSW